MIAVMELMNFKMTVEAAFGQFKARDFDAKKTVSFIVSLHSMPYYMLDAARAIGGEKYLVKALDHATTNSGIYKNIGKNLGQKLFKDEIVKLGIKTTRFNFWSVNLSLVGGLLYTWDMLVSISAEDYDAASGYGLAAFGSFGLAMAKFGAGAEIGTFLYAIHPYGWIFLAVTIIGAAIAIACKDKDLERWSKHGPFALHHEDRWTKAYEGKDTRIVLGRHHGRAYDTPCRHALRPLKRPG